MKHKLKDPGSAITHLIGMILAAIVSIPLIIKSFLSGDYVRIISDHIYYKYDRSLWRKYCLSLF